MGLPVLKKGHRRAAPMLDSPPTLSVVVPCFNEEAGLPALMERLLPALREASVDDYELLFVNDGSTDSTGPMLDSLARSDRRVRVIHLSRNFGHQAALSAGLQMSSGRAVACLDADLQDPPELLTGFVERWRAGYQVVYGVRRKRKEGLLRRAAFHVFYRSLRAVAHTDLPLDAGDFCLMDRQVVDRLVAMPEADRYLRGLRAWLGFRQSGLEYEREARHAGRPKYDTGSRIRFALSGYVGFSTLPLRLAFALSVLLTVLGVGVLGYGLWHATGWLAVTGAVLSVGGLQLFVLGILGEYLGRVHDEVRGRPAFVVSRRVGFEASGDLAASEQPPLTARH